MYTQAMPMTIGSIGYPSNGTIELVDIDFYNSAVVLNITAPWGDLYAGGMTYMTVGDIITATHIRYPPYYREAKYIVKLLSVSLPNVATFQVLSFVYDETLLRGPIGQNLLLVDDNFPLEALPGAVVNYNVRVTNISTETISFRYIFATNAGPTGSGQTPKIADVQSLPPTTYTNIHCWYNDWYSGILECQPRTIGPGVFYDITGTMTMPTSGDLYIRLGTFIYKTDYWGPGRSEYVAVIYGSGYEDAITINPCLGKVCSPDTICVGDNRYRAICNPADPMGPCIAGTEIVVPNDLTCNPCIGITCNNICDGLDLWSQKCVNGVCVKDTLIEPNSLTCPSHRIDFYIRPWPWYTPDGAITDLITLFVNIDGTITNFFSDIIDYKYLNTEIFKDGDHVVIRINIRQLPSMSGVYAMAWPLAILKILTLVVLVGLIIIGIGMIYNYLWYLIANPMALNPALTNKDLTDAGNTLVKEQLDNCETVTCMDPSLSQDQKATCIKNCHDGILVPWKDYQKKIYPDADHTPLDDATLAIQVCYDTYVASAKATTDYNTYLSCLKIERETYIDKDQDNTLEKYDPDASAGEKEKPGGGLGLILLAGAGIVGLTLLSKGGAPSTVVVSPSPQPTIVKEKEPSIIERGYARVKEEVQKRL